MLAAVQILNLTANAWTQANFTAQAARGDPLPQGRLAHTAMRSAGGSQMLAFGGISNFGASLSDLWYALESRYFVDVC